MKNLNAYSNTPKVKEEPKPIIKPRNLILKQFKSRLKLNVANEVAKARAAQLKEEFDKETDESKKELIFQDILYADKFSEIKSCKY